LGFVISLDCYIVFLPFVFPLFVFPLRISFKTVVSRYHRGARTPATLRYGADGGGEARGGRGARGARREREGRETGGRETGVREKERREGGERV
jgi:hypothetical protein